MKNNFLLLVLLSFCLSGKSQLITIQFSDSLYAEQDPGHGFGMTYLVKDHSVSTHHGTYTFSYPSEYNSLDTLFCQEYFIGIEGKVNNGLGILVEQQANSLPTLYIDQNNDLDFSNDGSPLTFSDSTAYLIFQGKPDSNARFGISYWINDPSSQDWAKFDTAMGVPQLIANGISIQSSKDWFHTKRHNNKIVKTILNRDSVKIALHDYNVNGRFNDAGSDMIFVNNPEVPFDSNPTSGCITLDSTSTLFAFHNQVYRVLEIDPFGRFITIEPSNLTYKKPLGPGDTMPNLKLPTPNGDSLALQSLLDGRHYLVIELWADWCKPCHASAPKLKEFAAKYKDKVKMLGISPHNINDAVAKYTTKYNHDWTQALTTKEFMKTFLADEYPRYILVDPKGKIISLKTYPHLVEGIIK